MVSKELFTIEKIITFNVIIFFLLLLLMSFFENFQPVELFGAVSVLNENFNFYSVISYTFLHSNMLHLYLNVVVLYFLRKPLNKIESKEIWNVYLFAGIFGYIGHLIMNINNGIYLIGSSASIAGLVAYYCFENWDYKIPIIKGIYTTPMILLTIYICSEFNSLNIPSNISHISHLFGILGAYILYQSKRFI